MTAIPDLDGPDLDGPDLDGPDLDGRELDVVVVGGGQAGLACGYYLQRAGFRAGTDFAILDAEPEPGGAWRHAWDSLTLFSPSDHSSLPGWLMPPWTDGFPPADHVRAYLAAYEERFALDVVRPVHVQAVRRASDAERPYLVDTDAGTLRTRLVVSATGTWSRPFWPAYPGQRTFRGRQVHTADYRSPGPFAGQRVVVVGGGNSAAQLLAEISTVADTTWVAPRPPRFLPDHVDGRELFGVATDRAAALQRGEDDPGGVASLGDIVMVPPVLEARERGVLHALPAFESMSAEAVHWSDGTSRPADAVVWCTGFRPELAHLAPLDLSRQDGHPAVDGTELVEAPGVHLVGYGDWTGPASATLIGAGMSARRLAHALGWRAARRR